MTPLLDGYFYLLDFSPRLGLKGRIVFGWLLQPRRMESPFWPIPKTQIEGKRFVVSQVLFKLCGSSTGTGDGEETLTFVGDLGGLGRTTCPYNVTMSHTQCHSLWESKGYIVALARREVA